MLDYIIRIPILSINTYTCLHISCKSLSLYVYTYIFRDRERENTLIHILAQGCLAQDKVQSVTWVLNSAKSLTASCANKFA